MRGHGWAAWQCLFLLVNPLPAGTGLETGSCQDWKFGTVDTAWSQF
jgi:hypothetical protein